MRVLLQSPMKGTAFLVAKRLRSMGCDVFAGSDFPRFYYWNADLVLVNTFMDDWVVLKDWTGGLYGQTLHLSAP